MKFPWGLVWYTRTGVEGSTAVSCQLSNWVSDAESKARWRVGKERRSTRSTTTPYFTVLVGRMLALASWTSWAAKEWLRGARWTYWSSSMPKAFT